MCSLNLVQRRSGGQDQVIVLPTASRIEFGRHGGQVDVEITDALASRRHFALEVQDKGLLIKDLNSTHGTFVNEVKLDSGSFQKLKVGDIVTVASKAVTYEVREEKRQSSQEENKRSAASDKRSPPHEEHTQLMQPPPPPPPPPKCTSPEDKYNNSKDEYKYDNEEYYQGRNNSDYRRREKDESRTRYRSERSHGRRDDDNGGRLKRQRGWSSERYSRNSSGDCQNNYKRRGSRRDGHHYNRDDDRRRRGDGRQHDGEGLVSTMVSGPKHLSNNGLMSTTPGGGIGFAPAAPQLNVQQKRKLLWGNKGQDQSQKWQQAEFGTDEDKSKFKRLMGVKQQEQPGRQQSDNGKVLKRDEQEKIFTEVEGQFFVGLRRADGRTVGLGL
eukprot:TRINITY_DN2546_c1_g2_i2.p1 TRINITY_DN2546_c1_g2~~TRINITY_DN2546_c1_g2_i2.p1  ORF type:complete len:384 (-),score=56.98 TRINITY_DN2546_c1_g2_i2:234-1385(-)